MYFDEVEESELQQILASRTPAQRLQDIQGAIANIEQYAIQGRQAFDEDELVQVWMIYHLMVIGEAIRNLPQVLKQNNFHPLWEHMTDIADALLHEYYVIDMNAVWTIVEKDIPALKALLCALL